MRTAWLKGSAWLGTLQRLRQSFVVQDESGSALIELALVVGILGVPLMLGTTEMGILAYDSIEVTDAANAGTMYGMRSATFAANSSGITTAAQGEASDFGTRLTVTPTTYFVCATAMGGTQYSGSGAAANAAAACTGSNNHPVQLIQVNTRILVSPPITCPGLPNSFTLYGKSVMEVEQ